MKPRLYLITKKVHLYSSLITAAILLMYVVTSYMMIYHDWFPIEKGNVSTISVKVTPEEISDVNWNSFLRKYKVKGRLQRENFKESGDLVRSYSSAGGNSKITLFKDKNEVEIISTKLNASGSIIGLHRLRGYGGPVLFNIYAFLLDLVGVSLMLFAVTGVILWMKLLKHNKLAWTILILGFVYVSVVMGYLIII